MQIFRLCSSASSVLYLSRFTAFPLFSSLLFGYISVAFHQHIDTSLLVSPSRPLLLTYSLHVFYRQSVVSVHIFIVCFGSSIYVFVSLRILSIVLFCLLVWHVLSLRMPKKHRTVEAMSFWVTCVMHALACVIHDTIAPNACHLAASPSGETQQAI